MPRNPGTGVYSKPSPDVITGTTIESTVYNTFVGDVETDLNTARPVSSGGTGATSADGALVNLSGEKAAQLVASYDTHLWMPGSFRSAIGATGAPNSTSSFSGIAYINEALANPPTNQNVVVEARDMDSPVKPGLLYTRQKTAGVWSAWNYTATGADQAAARSAIYAAPFDAMAYNGMQLNGAFEVDQAGAGAVTAAGLYFCDCWQFGFATTGGAAVGAVRVTLAGVFTGLPSYGQISVGTPQGTLTTTDNINMQTRIEGWRIMHLAWGTAAAQPISIGFWSKHFRAGVYSVTVRNGAANRSYAATYTHATSEVSQYNVINIPGCVDGVWNVDHTVGFQIIFSMGAGPTATAPTANAWSVGGFAAAPGQINGIQSVADIFRLTGVVVLAGLQAPTASQSALIMRPGEQELMMCQRYYYRRDHISGDWVSTLQAYTASLASGPLFAFPTRMRVSPTGLTVTPPPAFQLVTAAGVGLDANVSGVINTTPDAAYVSGVGIPTASLVAGNATLFTSKGSTHTFDARL